jgi:hypothetical protein
VRKGHATLYIFLQFGYCKVNEYTVKETGEKPDRKPHPLLYGLTIQTETSSLIILKIMPRNLNEIVHS